jgi:hypothetical protein
MEYKSEDDGRGSCKQVVGVGFVENVKWPEYKGRFHSHGGRGDCLQSTEQGLRIVLGLQCQMGLSHAPKFLGS